MSTEKKNEPEFVQLKDYLKKEFTPGLQSTLTKAKEALVGELREIAQKLDEIHTLISDEIAKPPTAQPTVTKSEAAGFAKNLYYPWNRLGARAKY